MTKVKCWSYLPIRSLTFLYLWVKWGVRNSSRRCKSSGTLHSCCTKAFWTANSRLKNTKQKHFIISSFTGINHHIYCSFWRKGDECTCRHFKHYIFFCHILPGIFKRWGPLFDWFFHEQFKESVQPVWVSTFWHDGKEGPPILHCLTGDVL